MDERFLKLKPRVQEIVTWLFQHNTVPENICRGCGEFCTKAIYLYVTKHGDEQRAFCQNCVRTCVFCEEDHAPGMEYQHDDCFMQCYDCDIRVFDEEGFVLKRVPGKEDQKICTDCDKMYGYCSHVGSDGNECRRATMMNDSCEQHLF
jgi:hypothetical protein